MGRREGEYCGTGYGISVNVSTPVTDANKSRMRFFKVVVELQKAKTFK
ncbi:MAG: hypothetical protein ACI4QT_00415 [Kiritimatiellia bacterium]